MKRILLLALALSVGLFAAAQEEVTVTFVGGSAGLGLDLDRASAEAYMANNPHTIGGVEYNVTVNVVPGPESATDRLGLYRQFFEAQSGEADVLMIDVIWPGDLRQNLLDLYEFEGFTEAVEEHFPAIVENNTVDGALVGMPWYTDAGLLYYRTDLLEEYGFDGPPETWNELEEMATTIQEGVREENPDFYGFVWQGNAYEGLTCDALEWIASNNGGDIVSPDGVITISNQNAIDILEQAAGWVGTISPPGVTGFQEEDARRFFQAGNAAFMRNWPYAYSIGQNPETSEIAGLFDVSPLPRGDVEGGSPAATLGGWQLGVSRYSQNPAVAADVALYYASYENQKTRAIDGSFNPTIPALYEDEDVLAAVPFFGELLDVFTNAVARPSTVTAPDYAEVSRAFFTAVHSVLTGEEDAETALLIAELDIQEITGLEVGDPE